MDPYDDDVFAGLSRENRRQIFVETDTIKQSVGTIELTDEQTEMYGEETPKFTGWDGFWADPVFEHVTGRRVPVPPGQSREYWKYEVDDSVPLSSLFPSLASSAFGPVSFHKSAVEWWAHPIHDQPAGLYLRTEIEFNGLLDEVFSVFKHFLGEAAKPKLKLSAYLGFAQVPDGSYSIDGLTFSGSLLGLRTPMPPVLELITVLSIGLELNIGRSNSVDEIASPTSSAKSEFISWSIFGDVHITIPGFAGLMLLGYKATLQETSLRFDMTMPGDGKWKNPLGVESLSLDEVKFLVHIPISDADKGDEGGTSRQVQAGSSSTRPTAMELDKSLSFAVSAKWKTSSAGTLGLKGVVYKDYPDESYLEGTLEKVTWSDIKKLFSDIHGDDLESSDHDITCENLTIRVSKAQLSLTGALTINGRRLAQATVIISSAGLLIRAQVESWDLDDGYVTIHDMSLTLVIGRSQSSSSTQTKEGEKQKATDGGWSGGLDITGRILIQEGVTKPMDIKVSVTVGKQKNQWFWMLCGHMDSDISLRDFVSSIDENSELDVRLTSVSLVASSIDNVQCAMSSNGYVIRKGIFLWATISQIPYLKIGGAVKEPAPGDRTEISIGWQKGSSMPSVSIFLPKSLKIDIGPRFRSDRFELQFGPKGLSFIGGFQVHVNDDEEWLQFRLTATIDPTELVGELLFKGNINNPLGLSKEITIGPKLAIGLQLNWAQLASTGTPQGVGFMGSFYVGEINQTNAYEMVMYVCENPKDLLIKVDAPRMDYLKLAQLIAAVMEEKIPSTDMKIFELRDVLIYASPGVTFADEYFPPGFQLRGQIIIFDHEAGMDCTLSTEGFTLKAWLQTIELGPLKIGGDVTLPDRPGMTFALLDVEITAQTQKFILSGYVELFKLRASIELYIQILPTPIFYFDLQLAWSDLIKIQAKAMMISKGEEKSLTKKLSNADWAISVQIEQRIIQEMVETLQKALRKLHEAIQEKLEQAKATVLEAEREYKAQIEAAEKKLQESRDVFKRQNDDLDAQIAALDRETEEENNVHRRNVENAKIDQTNRVHQASEHRDSEMRKEKNKVDASQTNLRNTEENGRNSNNNAVSDRERRKQDFMSKFGDAQDAINSAESAVNDANNAVDSLEDEISDLESDLRHLDWTDFWRAPDISIRIAGLGVALGSAKIGLGVALGVLRSAKAVLDSPLFKELQNLWWRAIEAIDTIRKSVELAINEAVNQLANAQKLFEIAELALKGDFDKAAQAAQNMVDEAQRSWDNYEKKQKIQFEILKCQLTALGNTGVGLGLAAAETALEVAKNNNIAFKAASAGLEAVQAVEGAVFTTLNEVIKAAGSLCDIRVARLSGTLTADTNDQKPFEIHMEGVIVGTPFTLDLDFTPGDTAAFLENMVKAAIKKLT